MLNDDVFLDALKHAPHTKEPLMMFCSTFLEKAHILEENPADKTLYDNPVGEPVKKALGRISRICRACCHFFCHDLSAELEETTDKDVTDFIRQSATEMPERTIKMLFQEPESWWHKEHEDMIKKGASAVLTSEKRQELKALLEIPDPTAVAIKQCLELMKEMHKSMRSQRLAMLREQFKVTLQQADTNLVSPNYK